MFCERVNWSASRECRVISSVKSFPFPSSISPTCWLGSARRRSYRCPCSPYCDVSVFCLRWFWSLLFYRQVETINISLLVSLKVRPNRLVIWSVVIMIVGALVAAGNDLAFELTAYTFILLNDLFTALYGVYTKKRLNSDLGKYGLLFYNSVFRLIIWKNILV